MAGSQEVVIKLTEEQREQITGFTGTDAGSVLLIEMYYRETVPNWEAPAVGQPQLTTISST